MPLMTRWPMTARPLRSRRLAVALAGLVVAAVLPLTRPAQAAVPFDRVAGIDRFETAVRVGLLVAPATGGKVVVATGDGFADALAAGPAALALGPAPILLVRRDS